MKRTITLFAIVLLCAVSLFAQAPEKFSYQAVVRNASNALVTDAQVGVRVSILQGSADGNAVYVETHAASTNANGLLTVEIGGGKAEQGSFADIDWANGPYFLKTETDPNGGSDYSVTITQQLLSVPYALYAREAANSFSGDYNDLRNKPEIPQVPSDVSAFNNDAGYITKSDLPESSKGGGADDAGVVQTTDCGEIDLCKLAAQLEQLQQMRTVLLPTVTTGAVNNVTETTASCGGRVTGSGYTAVIGRGVCWGTEPNPTLEGSHTNDGTGTGTFTSSLTGLVVNTTYYVRAYATNSIGTTYGEDVNFMTFSTPADAPPCPNTPTVMDDDGNVYNTVQIGLQCWMRQNLRTTKKADGTSIPAGGSDTSTTAPYYYDYSNSSIPLSERGYLYNWPAAMVACPAGWHLPSDVEWTQLTNYVKGQSEYVCDGNADNIAKALASTSGWNSTSTACAVGNAPESNNAMGFSSVPAGRCDGSSFRSSGLVVHYWSSTEINTAVYERYLHYKSAEVSRSNSGKADGFSVRCLRDGCPIVDEKSCPDASTVTDVDGNVYTTVQIGEQCWMRQNLRTTKYADGTAIPFGRSNSSNTAPYYYNYSSSDIPLSERGYLYNWTAAIEACPEGWHLPGDAEWTQLENYLKSQGDYVCGNNTNYIAKALASETCWNSSSVECSPGNQTVHANNTTGFSAIAAGRCDGSSYLYSGNYALFWSSTEGINSTRAWGRNLLSNEATMKRNDNSTKSYGRSVRCLRGETPSGGDNPFGGDTLNTPVVDEKSCSGTPTVTDHEGNVYATVQIGQQCWMRDNLRTTTSPRTGTYLVNNQFTSGTSIAYTYTGKMARWYNNDSATYAPKNYGLLYNWNAAVDTFNTAYGETSVNTSSGNAVSVTFGGRRRGICPEGWHLPSNAEWEQLLKYVRSQSEYTCGGNTNSIAKALASETGWAASTSDCVVGHNPTVNNASGFSAVPAGNYYGSSFNGAGSYAYFWSAKQSVGYRAYEHRLDYCSALNHQGETSKYSGYSVRCLRNGPPSSGDTLNTPVVDEKSCSGTPTVTDHEGNVYATLQIGEQCWMRDNLRTMTSPRTGTYLIPAAGTDYTYSGKQARWYDNDSALYASTNYGLLYNWNAAVDTFNTAYGETSVNTNSDNVVSVTFKGRRRGICPTGWHLPSDAEWNTMEKTVSGSDWQTSYETSTGYRGSHAGKLAGGDDWIIRTTSGAPGDYDNTDRNASGFSAVPAGRCSGSSFNSAGGYAYFWSATRNSSSTAFIHYLTSNYVGVNRNAYGRNYGFSVRCLRDETDTLPPPVVDEKSCSGTPMVTDHEGNVYATVQIGDQCWMRDNLRTKTSPSTGTYLIPVDGTSYSYSGKQARWYNNDSATYVLMNYGLLYNWNAAVDTFNTVYGETSVNSNSDNIVLVTFSGRRRGICPTGWHLPSDAEWNTMEETVSGSDWQGRYKITTGYRGSHAGKLAGGDNWVIRTTSGAPGDYDNTDRNASGFSAVPAGRCNGSSFNSAGGYAYFWSATQSSSVSAFIRYLTSNYAGVNRNAYGKEYGFSVRCLRDETLPGGDTLNTPVVDEKSCSGTPMVTDHEGNVYATVQIGDQCWMRENLRTTTSPRTGTRLIPASSANYTYTGKQARWYNNDSATYVSKNYGLLYNWNAAVDTFNTAYGETSVNTNSSNVVSVTFSGHRRGICPTGWHLPSDAEWSTMERTVSGSEWQTSYETTYGEYRGSHAGKLAGGDNWTTSTTSGAPGDYGNAARNASGFSAVPAGYCTGSSFYSAGGNANFWSATQSSSGNAYNRLLDYGGVGVYRSGYVKSGGRSVRCLRD